MPKDFEPYDGREEMEQFIAQSERLERGEITQEQHDAECIRLAAEIGRKSELKRAADLKAWRRRRNLRGLLWLAGAVLSYFYIRFLLWQNV